MPFQPSKIVHIANYSSCDPKETNLSSKYKGYFYSVLYCVLQHHNLKSMRIQTHVYLNPILKGGLKDCSHCKLLQLRPPKEGICYCVLQCMFLFATLQYLFSNTIQNIKPNLKRRIKRLFALQTTPVVAPKERVWRCVLQHGNHLSFQVVATVSVAS